jgi:hypothetical protein
MHDTVPFDRNIVFLKLKQNNLILEGLPSVEFVPDMELTGFRPFNSPTNNNFKYSAVRIVL